MVAEVLLVQRLVFTAGLHVSHGFVELGLKGRIVLADSHTHGVGTEHAGQVDGLFSKRGLLNEHVVRSRLVVENRISTTVGQFEDGFTGVVEGLDRGTFNFLGLGGGSRTDLNSDGFALQVSKVIDFAGIGFGDQDAQAGFIERFRKEVRTKTWTKNLL